MSQDNAASPPAAPNAPSTLAFWAGWVLSILPSLLFLMSTAMKLLQRPEVMEGLPKSGWPAEYVVGLGIVELVCTLLYLVPQTCVLGAILLTGYLGGAIATHVRTGDFAIYLHVALGVMLWLGLYLREPRLQPLLPLKF